jgi:hypothetical protein
MGSRWGEPTQSQTVLHASIARTATSRMSAPYNETTLGGSLHRSERLLRGAEFGRLDVAEGSAPPVRAAGKQSSGQRDRPAAIRGPLYLV